LPLAPLKDHKIHCRETIVMIHFLTCLLILAAPSEVTLPGLENLHAGLTREQVLTSPEWKRAMLSLSTWFDNQRMYSPEEVLDFKREINRRVKDMTPTELLALQNEITAKLAVLNSPAAQEVRTYLREQLSLASEEYAARIRSHLPDIARMSPDEMQDYLNKFIARANAEQRKTDAFLQAKRQQAQMVTSTLNQQRQDANRAIDAAVRSGGWGGANSGVIGAKNITGGEIPTAAGYWNMNWIGGWGW
jgi:hypothetical protein